MIIFGLAGVGPWLLGLGLDIPIDVLGLCLVTQVLGLSFGFAFLVNITGRTIHTVGIELRSASELPLSAGRPYRLLDSTPTYHPK